MKANIELNFIESEKLAKHLSGIPQCFMEMELGDFNLIHPKGDEDIEHIFDNKKKYDLEEFKNNQGIPELEGKGGIYCLMFSGDKKVYFGESINLNNRLVEHYNCLNGYKKCTQRQLLDAYKKSKKQAEVVILESGSVSEYTKAEFKMYCLKREHFYCELFTNNKRKVYNYENTLHAFYVSYGKIYGDNRKASTLATSMKQLEEMSKKEIAESDDCYQEAIKSWERVQEVLKSRKLYRKGGTHTYAIKTNVNPSNSVAPVYYVKAYSESEARAKLDEAIKKSEIIRVEQLEATEAHQAEKYFWLFDIARDI